MIDDKLRGGGASSNGDGGNPSRDGGDSSGERLMREIDRALGAAHHWIDDRDRKKLDDLANNYGKRTVVEALKRKWETKNNKRWSVFHSIMHLGDPREDLPFVRQAFIEKGCQAEPGGWTFHG